MQLSLHLTRFCVTVTALRWPFPTPASPSNLPRSRPSQILIKLRHRKCRLRRSLPRWSIRQGPAISLQTSEAVFDIAVALNACGYDNGLAESDPIREHIREQVNQATQQSTDAREPATTCASTSISTGWRRRDATWRSIFRWRCT